MRTVRKMARLLVLAAILLAPRAAEAGPISVLVGDKDWFGSGLSGPLGPWPGWPGPVVDNRSAAEAASTTGAHLTDVYSALYYYGTGSGCDALTDPGCSPNGDIGTMSIPFAGVLNSGAISILMGDFECSLYGAMTVDINGEFVDFCFDDGFQGVALRQFALTSQMIAVANQTGLIQMTFDHRGGYMDSFGVVCSPARASSDPDCNTWFGSFDYLAFDYFELNADIDPVPEPSTLVLIGLGLAGLAARRRWRQPR